MNTIRTAAGRNKLAIRREPYWKITQRGQALDYRKISDTRGSWIAKLTINRKRHYQKLEVPSTASNPHASALREANKWFNIFLSGTNEEYTLQNAVDDYIKYTEAERSPNSLRFVKRHLNALPSSLLSLPLYKITTAQLRNWRDSFLITDCPECMKKHYPDVDIV